MPTILDHIAREPALFRPRNTREFFAFQLARHLGDAANVRGYVPLVDAYGERVAARAVARLPQASAASTPLERFATALKAVSD